jgi:hypothetical protein
VLLIVDLWQKTSQFKASCKDSKKLQESWNNKTAKSFSRTRHMHGLEVLMSLQTRAKFKGTHSTTSVTVSVIRDFNMTWYLVVLNFLFLTCSQWRLWVLLLTVAVFLLIYHGAVGLLSLRLTMNSCSWIVAVYYWVIILLLNHTDTVQVTPKRRNTNRYGYWKVNVVQIWHETGSQTVLPTFFNRLN